jgi:hypothetical protein
MTDETRFRLAIAGGILSSAALLFSLLYAPGLVKAITIGVFLVAMVFLRYLAITAGATRRQIQGLKIFMTIYGLVTLAVFFVIMFGDRSRH